MPEQPLVSVRGEAVIKVEPEVARLEVSVVSRDAGRTAALHMLEERVASVSKILATFDDIVDSVDNTGLRVSPQLSNKRPPERIPGFVGICRQGVVVTGFDRIGELMTELTALELTEVGGPWWELRADSAVYRDARISAVRDAIRRARDYADGLGCQLTGLVELADARMMSDGGASEQGARFTAKLPQRTRVAAPEEFSFDLAPAQQTVRASIEARFRISQPDLVKLAER
jgi:uncharacterized protein YggE